MGCHTWFKAPSKCTIDELRELWLAESNRNMTCVMEVLDNTDHEYYGYLMSNINKFYHGDEIYYLSVLLRKHKMVENHTIKYAFINHIYFLDKYKGEKLFEYTNGQIYAETDDCPHDLFRRYGYPDDKLFSLEETLKYINDTANACVIYDHTVDKLTKFFTKYPDGYIHFG